MPKTEVATAVKAVHMRVTYFAAGSSELTTPAVRLAPVTPRALARATHQLELMIEYAALLSDGQTSARNPVDQKIRPLSESALDVGDLVHLFGQDPSFAESALDQLSEGRHAELTKGTAAIMARLSAKLSAQRDERVTVASVHLSSPLEVVLAIPVVVWPGLAIGLLALAELIATAPVRISRKRKEELLKSAILDTRIALAESGRADVLAELLLEEGPAPRLGPSEIVFDDPDEPEDELEYLSVGR